MKPKILLSLKGKQENYINAVKGVLGEPAAAYLPKVDLSFDGLILGGGPDVHPKYYGEKINGSENIDILRDEAEFLLADAFIKAGKPVMGICRGAQLLNIYFGGTLYQDIETAFLHRSGSDIDLVHPVIAEKGSIAEMLYGESFAVNSFHHQAVKLPGKDLRITVREKETGAVEGFEHTSLPVFGVQWHPERMCFRNRRADTADGACIFEYFIKLCKNGRL